MATSIRSWSNWSRLLKAVSYLKPIEPAVAKAAALAAVLVRQIKSAGSLAEELYSLWSFIRRTEGLEAWDAFEVVLSRTVGNKSVDAALAPVVNGVTKDAYSEAAQEVLRGRGASALTKVPTHAEAKAAMASRLAPATLQSNHTVPKYIQKLLKIDTAVQDSVPSLILEQVDHTGAGMESFHNILYAKIPKATPIGAFSNGQILQKLEQAYTEFGRPDVWTVTREWLRTQNI